MACFGKKDYSSWALADKVSKSTSRRTGEFLTPYSCNKCKHFHIGHKDVIVKIGRRRKAKAELVRLEDE